MKTIVEIGANTGKDTNSLIPDRGILYAFEPSPPLYRDLVKDHKNDKRVVILPFAVDLENSVKQFNVSLAFDMGLGSLYDFHPDIANTALVKYDVFSSKPNWKQNVLTIRLDTFMDNWNIDKIDYIHMDAQGNDFNCIKSLGNRILDVQEGRCECTWEIKLYDGPDNYFENVVSYLETTGKFKTEVIYRHENNSEIDIRFYR